MEQSKNRIIYIVENKSNKNDRQVFPTESNEIAIKYLDKLGADKYYLYTKLVY